MKTPLFALCALLLSLLQPFAAHAQILQIRVDLSDQQMQVYLDNQQLYDWPISSARSGKVTPTGTFQPQFLSASHRSSLYNNAPMPWSIFFHGNYAIHGTTELSRLGSPASAGCVRLHPDNAKALFALVQQTGTHDTFIVIAP